MSLKATIDNNNIKYGIGDGNFLVYDHQGNELNRFFIKDIGFTVGRNSTNEEVYKLIVTLTNGDEIHFNEDPRLTSFVEALENEKLRSNN